VATHYRVSCDCGRSHQVSGGDAGSHLPCGCGRTVDVPDLHTLRTSVGEPTISPELAIEMMMRDRQIPGDGTCLCCGAMTADICHVQVECERPEVNKGGWKLNLLPTLAGLLFGFVIWHREWNNEQVRGRHVAFRLPMRTCSACARSLSKTEIGTALRQINVYRQLLDKYPHASIGRLEC
jgi:transcription elongation factor Elf1